MSWKRRCWTGPASPRRGPGGRWPWGSSRPSYAHRGEAPPRGEEVVDHARAEHPGGQAGQDAEAEGHREAAHRAAAELEHDEPRAEGGDVRVADRVPRPLVASFDRGARRLPQAQLLADALEDEDVGLDRHPDG